MLGIVSESKRERASASRFLDTWDPVRLDVYIMFGCEEDDTLERLHCAIARLRIEPSERPVKTVELSV
jgi:hypothetical protein